MSLRKLKTVLYFFLNFSLFPPPPKLHISLSEILGKSDFFFCVFACLLNGLIGSCIFVYFCIRSVVVSYHVTSGKYCMLNAFIVFHFSS